MRCGTLSTLLLGAAAADESMWRSDRLSVRNESMALRYYLDGVRVSPWHDVPYLAGDDSATGRPLLHFVCEIPRGVSAKVEIHKSVPYNDLVQDVNKDGSPRYYTYSPSTVNYGAIPQTWEDPHHADAHTGLGGDNDPIDVLQLNEGSCVAGAVQRVRVLGALALVDGGETDWKLLVVDVDAADAPAWRELGDVPAERVNEVREWFRLYKTSDGKPPNEYGLNGEPIDAAAALAVAAETHALWGGAGRARCEFGGEPCWGMEARRSVDWRSAGAAVFALLAVAQLYFIVTAVQRKRRALAAASPKKKR